MEKFGILPTHAHGWLAGSTGHFICVYEHVLRGYRHTQCVAVAKFIGPLAVAVTGGHWREYIEIIIAVCGIVTLSWSSFASRTGSLAGAGGNQRGSGGFQLSPGRRIALGGRLYGSWPHTIGFALVSIPYAPRYPWRYHPSLLQHLNFSGRGDTR